MGIEEKSNRVKTLVEKGTNVLLHTTGMVAVVKTFKKEGENVFVVAEVQDEEVRLDSNEFNISWSVLD